MCCSRKTTLQVLKEPGCSSASKSYMWLYRTSGCAQQVVVLYEYQPTKKVDHAEVFLRGFNDWCTRMGTRDTISYPRRCRRTLQQRLTNAIAPDFSSWSRRLQS